MVRQPQQIRFTLSSRSSLQRGHRLRFVASRYDACLPAVLRPWRYHLAEMSGQLQAGDGQGPITAPMLMNARPQHPQCRGGGQQPQEVGLAAMRMPV